MKIDEILAIYEEKRQLKKKLYGKKYAKETVRIIAITKKLRGTRKSQGYRQSDISESIGLSTPSYALIETGASHPRQKTAQKICDFLNKSFDDLFTLIQIKRKAG